MDGAQRSEEASSVNLYLVTFAIVGGGKWMNPTISTYYTGESYGDVAQKGLDFLLKDNQGFRIKSIELVQEDIK